MRLSQLNRLKAPISFLLLFLTTTYELAAFQKGRKAEPPPPVEEVSSTYPVHRWIEEKVGYFFFTDSKMAKIYDEGGIDVQLSGAFPVWKKLQVYASIEYFQKSGHTQVFHSPASIQGLPISLGLQLFTSPRNWVDCFIGIGPRYLFIWGEFDTTTLQHHLDQNGFGGYVNGGLNFFPSEKYDYFLGFFAEYSYVPLSFHPDKTDVYGQSRDVGGVVLGSSIGYAF